MNLKQEVELVSSASSYVLNHGYGRIDLINRAEDLS